MLSQTFATALGAHAQHVYLRNARLDAASAHALGLVHQLCTGVAATKTSVRVPPRLAAGVVAAVCYRRATVDRAVLASEAVGHTECQLTNMGFAKSVSAADPLLARGVEW